MWQKLLDKIAEIAAEKVAKQLALTAGSFHVLNKHSKLLIVVNHERYVQNLSEFLTEFGVEQNSVAIIAADRNDPMYLLNLTNYQE